jgi:hypothetical protein
MATSQGVGNFMEWLIDPAHSLSRSASGLAQQLRQLGDIAGDPSRLILAE